MKHIQYIIAISFLVSGISVLAGAGDNATMRLGSGAAAEEPKRRSLIPSEVRSVKKIPQARHKPADPELLAAGGRKGRKAREQQRRYEAEQKKLQMAQNQDDSPRWFSIPSIDEFRTRRKERVAKKNAEIDAQIAQLKPNQHRKRVELQRRKLHDWTTFSEMDVNELMTTKNKLAAQGNRQSTIKFIESILPVCDDLHKVHDLMLEAADLYFDEGQLQKAEKMYNEFTLLYPGSVKVEYALYKAILCAYYATLTIDRDQTKTHNALELTERFLKNEKMFTQYLPDVKRIEQDCVMKLADHELYIANYYVKKGLPSSLRAGQGRIAQVRDEYLPKIPGIEKNLLKTEIKLAEAINNTAIAQAKREELLSKYPEAVYEDSRRANERHRVKERTMAHAQQKKSIDVSSEPAAHFARRF